MAIGSFDPKTFDPKTNAVTQHLANPLGIGGNRTTRFLADPLGLFGGSRKPPTYSTDAAGNPLIGGQPYDPNRIYTNPKKAEAARQVAIKQGTARVNSVFDDPARAAQRADFLKAIREFYTGDANRQKGIADRNLKFSMARSGLTGGSAAVDSNRTLGEEYTKGLLDAENKAQGAYSDLEMQDEQTRLGLLAAVRSGMDATTAAQRAAGGMAQNAAGAKSDALAQGLGDSFGSTAQTYKTQREAADRRRGVIDAYGSVYGSKNPYAG